jgi:hypothetical protein
VGILALQSERDPEFDARWAAWIARGVDHDRRVRRRVAFAVPVTIIVVVILASVWFMR